MYSFKPGVNLCGIRVGLYGEPEGLDAGHGKRIIERLCAATSLMIDISNQQNSVSPRYEPRLYQTNAYAVTIPIERSQDWVNFATIPLILAQCSLDDQRWFFSFRTRGGAVKFCTYNIPDKLRNWSGKTFESLFDN